MPFHEPPKAATKSVVVVADIFGRTPHLEECASWFARDAAPLIVDPYCGSLRSFADEAEAHAAFQAERGLERLTDLVREAVAGVAGPVDLVGFSVGAAAVWRVAAEIPGPGRAVCFYGSRIRDYPDLAPRRETLLVFPRSEPSFDVRALARSLRGRPNVRVLRTPWLHGFLNPLSVNFSPRASARLRNVLERGEAGSLSAFL